MNQSILDLAKELIRIPSVSSDIEQLHGVVDRVMEEFSWIEGARVEKLVQNEIPCLVVSNFDEKRWDIWLNGHMDVVPASEEGQFDPTEKDGKLYARGSIDMKWAVAVMIQVMKEVLHQWSDKKISLILTCDEEVWWTDGAKFLADQWYGAEVILTPDAAWIHKIITAGKWVYTLQLQVPGKESHSAYPRKWENAIENAYHLYQELKDAVEETIELAQEDHRWTSVQMTTIKAGKAHNAIPWEAEITINIRHTESYSESLLKKLCSHVFKKYSATIISEKYWSLVFTESDHPALLSYKSISDEVTGWDLHFEKMHGATDAQHFAEKGAVSILHGPDGEFLHSKGEYADIESLYTLYEVTKKFVFLKD